MQLSHNKGMDPCDILPIRDLPEGTCGAASRSLEGWTYRRGIRPRSAGRSRTYYYISWLPDIPFSCVTGARMPEECSDDIRGFLQRTHESTRELLHLVGAFDDAAAEFVVLQVGPDMFVGIDVRLVRRQAKQGVAGSSAAGEFPKFTAMRMLEGSPVSMIVKFFGADASAAVRRWSDLLVCEHLALETLSAELGIRAAQSAI